MDTLCVQNKKLLPQGDIWVLPGGLGCPAHGVVVFCSNLGKGISAAVECYVMIISHPGISCFMPHGICTDSKLCNGHLHSVPIMAHGAGGAAILALASHELQQSLSSGNTLTTQAWQA